MRRGAAFGTIPPRIPIPHVDLHGVILDVMKQGLESTNMSERIAKINSK